MPVAHRTKLLPVLLCCTALVLPGQALAQALPTGGHVAAGSAAIGRPSNGKLTINQGSQRAVVNWQSFNVGAGNSVTINQPNANAALLNRVTGQGASNIAGSVNANGKVYLVNPNGIQITPSGSIDAKGGFVASTLNVGNGDFMAGKDKFTGNGASKAVTNQGSITTGQGGSVALIGGSVANEGTITAPLGKVALGAGEAATLDVNGDGFLQVAVPSGATDASGKPLVSNSGRIDAAGGTVEMKAAAVRDAMRQAVNMSGVIQARSVSGHDGQVVLGDGSGATSVSGKIDVSGDQQGGRIDVAGAQVELKGATLNASGGDAGGLVRVGGAFQGGKPQDPTSAQAQKYVTRFGAAPKIASADTTSMDAASTIDVSASGANGTGGAAIIWSNLSTVELGAIAARGALSGGAVEVSSHNALQSVALSRIATGKGGSLLLDPKNIVIDDNPATPDAAQNYAFADDAGSDLHLKGQDIMDVLSTGTDLTLQASNDITWNSTTGAAASSPTGIGKLTLDAGRSVIFNVVDTQLTFLDGSLTIIANDTAAAGVVDSDRDAGAAGISMLADPAAGSGLTAIVNAGYNNSPLAHTTTLSVDLRDGAGNTNRDVDSIKISQAFFSDVTLSAISAAQIQFNNAVFDVRNLTVTGNIQNGQGNELDLIGDNSATWTNEYASTLSTVSGVTTTFEFDNGDNLARVGRLRAGDSDVIHLILNPAAAFAVVYGDTIPSTSQSLTASIDPNSAVQSFAGTDGSTTIIRSSKFIPIFAQNPGDPVGPYTGTWQANGTLINGGLNASYLVDTSTFFRTAPALNITPRPVTVSAIDAGGFVYGNPNGNVAVTLAQDNGVTIAGVWNGDTVLPVVTFSGVTASQSMVDVSGTTGNPGDYAFGDHAPGGTRSYTVSSLSNSNYMIDSASSTLSAQSTITPALLIPTVSAGSYNYGSPDPLVTLSGVINGDIVAPIATITGLAGTQTMVDQGSGNYGFDAHTAAGLSRSYTLTGVGGDQSYNYTLDTSGTVSAALDIAPKTLTYASTGGGGATSVYGTPANLDLTLSGVLSGDDVSAAAIVTDSNNAPVTLAARTPAGSYTVSPNGLSGAQASDYAITSAASFGLVISKLGISFTAPSGTVNYGASFGGTVSLSGVLSGDDVTASLGIKQGGGSVALYDNHANAGTYQTQPIVSGAASGNYLVSGSAGSLVISPLPLNFALHDASVSYGSAALPSADLTGILFSDDVSPVVAVSAPGGYGSATAVGNYGASITGLSGAKAANYVLGAGIGASTLTVTPKALGFNSSGSSGTYGDASQSVVTLTGLVNLADNIAIHPQLTITDAAGNALVTSLDITSLGAASASFARLDAGTYTVSVTGIASSDSSHPVSNYSFTPATAQPITVARKQLTAGITDGPYTITYGSTVAFGLGITLTGFLSGEAGIGHYTMTDAQGHAVALGDPRDYTLGLSGSALIAGTDAGTYTVTVDTASFITQGTAKVSNYTILNSPSQTLTIAPKPLNWTVNDTTSTYGTLAAPVTSLRGIFGSDDVSLNNFSLTDSNGQVVTFNDRVMGSSTYTIRAAGLGGAKAADYTLATTGTNVAGTLTVSPKLVNWSVADTSDTYGSANALRDMGTVTLNGVLAGDTLGTVTGYHGANDTAVAIDGTTPAGSYQTYVSAITGTNTMLRDYTIGFVDTNHPGTLTIAPAPITLTVADTTLHYGTVLTSAAVNLTSGSLYNGDAIQVAAFAVADFGIGNVGDYTINAGVHGNSNYVITVVPGTLHVDALPLKYSIDDVSWVYGSQGDAISGYTPSVTFQKDETGAGISLAGGEFTTSILRGTQPVTLAARSDAGSYSLVATLNNPNFTLVAADSHPGTLTITPRVVTLLASSSVYGTKPVFLLGNVVAGDSLLLYGPTVTGTTGQAYSPDVMWNLDGSFRGNPDSLPVDSYSVTGGNLSTLSDTTRLGNYVLAPGAATTLSVTPRPITIVSMTRDAVTYGDGEVMHLPAQGQEAAEDIPTGYLSITDATKRTLFDGSVTYSGLVVAGDAFQITPYMLPFTTLDGAGTRTWFSDGVPILAAAGGSSCTQVGCMNLNYTLANPGIINPTVTVRPKLVTYSIADASGVYGSAAPVIVTISGVLPFFSADGSPKIGIFIGSSLAPRTTFAGGTVTNDPSFSQGDVVIYALQGGGNVPAGSGTMKLVGLTGTLGVNYTFVPDPKLAANINITPKPITYTTTSATAYTGVGSIAGSLDHLGDYTLAGLLPNDVVGVSMALDAGAAAAARNEVRFFPLSAAGSVDSGDYLIAVTSLVGPQAGNYSIAATGNSPGTLTAVDLYSDLNGLSFLGTNNAGSNVLNAASAVKAQERVAGNTVSANTSIDLSAITNDLTNYVAPPITGTLASIDISNGLQTTPTIDTYLAPPPIDPVLLALQLARSASDLRTSTDTSTSVSGGCSSANCIFVTPVGVTATGGADAQACAAGGAVCADGSASYNVRNVVAPTGASANDSVTAGVTDTANENCGAGTCTQTAHVDVSVGVSASGGVIMTSNSVDLTEGATATAGVTFNASNGISGEYGSIDSTVGTTIGGIGGSVGATSSFEDGTLKLGVSFSIDVGIGLDVNLNFGINTSAIGDFFNGSDTTYTYFSDPEAAREREETAIRYVQNAQSLAEQERDFVSDVLAGKYNASPDNIAYLAQSFKSEQTTLLANAQTAGFSMSRNTNGSFDIKDNTPPATTSQTVHHEGLIEALDL